jgi:hypothetical protein
VHDPWKRRRNLQYLDLQQWPSLYSLKSTLVFSRYTAILKQASKELTEGFDKTDCVPNSEADCLWCELLVAKQLLAKCCRALDYVKDWDLPRMTDCFLDAEITGVMYLIPFISRHVPFNLIQHQSLTQDELGSLFVHSLDPDDQVQAS